MKSKFAVVIAAIGLSAFGVGTTAHAAPPPPPPPPVVTTVVYHCPWGNVTIKTTVQAQSIIKPIYQSYGCTV
ncbi:hypothetical protein [Embleya sp. NPDC005575]|uniref:hypothetical protein n=1 Tax=Embleya sp. NPDC005575 TaxID=3156892 RepID=UPI0033A12E6A